MQSILTAGRLTAKAAPHNESDRLCANIPDDATCCPQQVVWWSTLLEKFQPEISCQPDVFGGEHGEQRNKDFRSVELLTAQILSVGQHTMLWRLPAPCAPPARSISSAHQTLCLPELSHTNFDPCLAAMHLGFCCAMLQTQH